MSNGSAQNREQVRKTAGQIAYEASAGDWVGDRPGPVRKIRPPWETLDARARQYWDRIGSAVRAPLIAALGTFVDGERAHPSEAIRGLWWQQTR